MILTRKLLVAVLVSSTTLTIAQQPGSVLNTDQETIYSSSPGISKNSAQSEHCKELHKKIDELKGKPQRRYAAAQRYKAECTNQDRQ